MRNVALFAEDYGHEQVVATLLQRIAAEFDVKYQLRLVSVRGGFGKVESELHEYVESLLKLDELLPDLIIVVTDSNCLGHQKRRKQLQKITEPIADRVIFGVPDPHVERWLLLFPAAFKKVLGESCNPPDQKCNRDKYKALLIQAVYDAGQIPLLGGMEHAEDIIMAMKLPKRKPQNELEGFVAELRTRLSRWNEEDKLSV